MFKALAITATPNFNLTISKQTGLTVASVRGKTTVKVKCGSYRYGFEHTLYINFNINIHVNLLTALPCTPHPHTTPIHSGLHQ